MFLPNKLALVGKISIVSYLLVVVVITLSPWLFGNLVMDNFFFSGFYAACDTGLRDVGNFSTFQRLLGFVVDLVGMGILTLSLSHLYRIISRIQIGDIFTKETTELFHKMASYYLVLVIYHPLQASALSLITTLHKPVGQRLVSVSFGTNNLTDIMIAVGLYITAYLMQESYKVHQENATVI